MYGSVVVVVAAAEEVERPASHGGQAIFLVVCEGKICYASGAISKEPAESSNKRSLFALKDLLSCQKTFETS